MGDFITNALADLSRDLYPQEARAFNMPFPDADGNGGFLFRLHRALAISEAQLWGDARSTFNSILPDTSLFTDGTSDPLDNDCNDWEGRLGMIQWGVTSASTPTTANRKLAIIRKMNYPGSTAPRQSALYLQDQLQAAGFNVNVYENIFSDGSGGWISKSPAEVLGISTGDAIYGETDYGLSEYGDDYSLDDITIIANHLEPALDDTFDIGDSYSSTFFIADPAGQTTFATVPAVRQTELRQLVLQIKPLQTIGFTFINFT